MIQTNTIGSFTEICGGNYLAESYPTNFHTFCKRKVLVGNDNVDNYREVTEAEKTAIEAQDSSYERPPQYFIEEVEMLGAVFNENTGFFELNGITDIAYQEMSRIKAHSFLQPRTNWNEKYQAGSSWGESKKRCLCRTYFPLLACMYESQGFNKTFYQNTVVESVAFYGGYGGGIHASFSSTFYECTNLEQIIFHGGSTIAVGTPSFKDCSKLKRFVNCSGFWGNNQTLDLSGSPLFEIDSIRKIVKGTGGINHTIILHPDVFNQVDDELMQEAIDKGMSIATV